MNLTPFEGTPVVSTGFILRAASGGLNAALVVNNLELHKDDEITLALRCKVHGVNFPPVKDTDGVQRVHVLDIMPAGVAVIDEATVAEALDQQRIRVEESKGVTRLPYSDDDDAEDVDDPAEDAPEPAPV